jgi:hypothetical protein
MKKMRGMVALCVALSVTAGSSALLAQKADNKQEVKRSKAEQLDIEVLLKAVDTVSAGQAAPTPMVTWESNHFIRSQDGTTYVPFTVQLDRSKLTSPTVALYVRVDTKGAAPARFEQLPVAIASNSVYDRAMRTLLQTLLLERRNSHGAAVHAQHRDRWRRPVL